MVLFRYCLFLSNQEDFLSNSMTPSEKNRNDHRHHAVDALVIALVDGRLLNFMGSLFSQKEKKRNQTFGMPWASFYQDAKGKSMELLCLIVRNCERAGHYMKLFITDQFI